MLLSPPLDPNHSVDKIIISLSCRKQNTRDGNVAESIDFVIVPHLKCLKMKFFFSLLFISKVLSQTEKYCETDTSDNWICQLEEDDTLTVTYDCNAISSPEIQERKIIWLWSKRFPKDMKTLIIQNCDEIDIYTDLLDYRRYGGNNDWPINFQVIQIVNVSDLHVTQKNQAEEESYSYRNKFNRRRNDRRSYCLPARVIIENVKNAKFDAPMNGQDFSCNNYELISFKLINVNINYFNGFFKNEYRSSFKIKEFVMDSVIMEKAGSDVIYIDHKEGLVIVKNSIIGFTENTFINGNGDQIIITNNSFKHLYGTRTFTLKANKIVFDGNDVSVSDTTFDFAAPDIKITNNIFHHVYENSFSNINSSTAIQKNVSSLYNFSNNIIHSVEPGAFDFNSKNPRQNLFDSIIISNNSIICACRNMYWFHSIAEKNYDFQKNFLRSKWFQTKNNNKCLNIENCTISQVLKNYQDLCDEDFDCSERLINSTIGTNCTENNREENVLENFLNYNNEIGEKNSKMLQILIKSIEENKNFASSDEGEKNASDFEFLVDDEFQEDNLGFLLRDMNVSKTCLVVLTCSFCVAILWVIIIKISKFSIIKILTNRSNLVTETEMNPSSVAELCTEMDE